MKTETNLLVIDYPEDGYNSDKEIYLIREDEEYYRIIGYIKKFDVIDRTGWIIAKGVPDLRIRKATEDDVELAALNAL